MDQRILTHFHNDALPDALPVERGRSRGALSPCCKKAGWSGKTTSGCKQGHQGIAGHTQQIKAQISPQSSLSQFLI